MRRRVAQPLRHAGLLLILASLPLVVVLLDSDRQATHSVLHVVASFVVLMLGFRIIGKRELGRLSPFELVTLMLIPEILSNTVQGGDSLIQSLAGLSTVLFMVVITSLLSQRFIGVQNLLEAKPRLLVVDGRLQEDAMNAERIAPDELFSEMRKQGLCNLGDIRFAILEGSGNLTFVPRAPRPSGHGSPEEPVGAA